MNFDDQASLWIGRLHDGLSREEERQLTEWLETDAAHRAAFARLSKMSAALDRAGAGGAANAVLGEVRIRGEYRRFRRRTLAAAAVAASLAIALGFWSGIRVPPGAAPAAPVLTQSDLLRRLPDGS